MNLTDYTSMTKDTELRHLPPGQLFNLCKILDEHGWKKLMAIIPVYQNNGTAELKYSAEHIRLVESHATRHSMSCSEILIQEWGTSGRVRPTIHTLLELLVKAELIRAATFIAVDVLNEPPPRNPTSGPAALINTQLGELSAIPDAFVSDTLMNLPYLMLEEITNGFCETPYKCDGQSKLSGFKLGAGAFGSVYYGKLPDGTPVAVKKLVNDEMVSICTQFETEITTLSKYQHPNLLPLLGFSCDTPDFCLVYEFMPNRSLQDRLALSYQRNREEDVLSWQQRLDIAIGVCRGIHHLHTFRSPPLIHRDVKTANILLDRNMNARLGDFGLVRSLSNGSKIFTSRAIGTSAYMSPEAHRGDISVKMDVYSVGVVLLELLTSQPPFDETRKEGTDLVTIFLDPEEAMDLSANDEGGHSATSVPLLDTTLSWDTNVAYQICEIALSCLRDKKLRPLVEEVLRNLESLNNISNNESSA